MRISDWSSDVCSSDLVTRGGRLRPPRPLARLRRIGEGREVQIPGLADQIVAEAVMALLVDQHEARLLVDAPRGVEHVVGPERDLPVAGAAREADALLDQPPADAEPARGRSSEEHTSELQSLMRISYAVFCLKKKNHEQYKRTLT